MKFSKLAIYFKEIEQTSSRLKITEFLSDLFKRLDEKEIDKTLYLLQGRVIPLFEKLDFGMAERMIIKATTKALNMERRLFENQFKKIGDLGVTIEHFKKEIKSFDEKDLTIQEVYQSLYDLAKSAGTGSQEKKINIIASLIRQLDPLSTCYLVRIPLGRMRLGFSDMTVLDAFSWMIKGDKSIRPDIEKAYHVRPDLGYIGHTLKVHGLSGLKHVKPALFTPILMMRAERLSSAHDIIEKIGKSIIEPKYDGFRLQIHYKKATGEVRLFSRNLDDVSYMYPDIIEGVKKEIKADEIIFEGEAIGFDPHSGNFLPFQDTVQRKRKYDITEKAKEIPLKLFAFELLYCNHSSFIERAFIERRRTLEKAIKLSGDIFKDTILLAPEITTDNEKELELMFDDALSKGLEGVIAKKISGIYQAGARGWNWIKFKKSYSTKIEDTIDCLIMGYDYGKGKRASFGIGAFLVGVYDQQNDLFKTVAKIGTGLTDDEWREIKKRCEQLKSKNRPSLYDVDKLMEVDVWVKPKIVVEIKADEITRSPVHTAGRKLKLTKSGAHIVDVAGFALRFPRLVHFRDDKRPDDATSLKEIEEMFKDQNTR